MAKKSSPKDVPRWGLDSWPPRGFTSAAPNPKPPKSPIPEVLADELYTDILVTFGNLHTYGVLTLSRLAAGFGVCKTPEVTRLEVSDSFSTSAFCFELSPVEYRIVVPAGLLFRCFVLGRLLLRNVFRKEVLPESEDKLELFMLPDELLVLSQDDLDDEDFARRLISLNASIGPLTEDDDCVCLVTSHILALTSLHESAHAALNHHGYGREAHQFCPPSEEAIRKRQHRIETDRERWKKRLVEWEGWLDVLQAAAGFRETSKMQRDAPDVPRGWSETTFHKGMEYVADSLALTLLTKSALSRSRFSPKELRARFSLLHWAVFIRFFLIHVAAGQGPLCDESDGYGHPTLRAWISIRQVMQAFLDSQFCVTEGFAEAFNDEAAVIDVMHTAIRYLSFDFTGNSRALLPLFEGRNPSALFKWFCKAERELDIVRFTEEVTNFCGAPRLVEEGAREAVGRE